MPNHVKNIVKMEGITKLPLFKTEYDEYEKRDVVCFDFNKIIPMPESLNVESGSMETMAIEAVNRKLSQRRYGFQPAYSRPQMSDEDYQQRLKNCGKTEGELLEMGLQYITNKVRYGATSWYDWRCDNWGTKWNAYSNEQEGEDTIIFETAWSNPEPVMLKLSEMYPEATIEHWWADEDMGSNDGHRVYRGGEIVEGDYHDSCSNEAYETYMKCWGESQCLYQDEDGLWQRYDCDTCHRCD